jgi:hypothetical protein
LRVRDKAERLQDRAGEDGLLQIFFHVLARFRAPRWQRAAFYKKPEPTWGKGKQERNCFALSFAGIIQIRYEGYLSPGTDSSRTPSEPRV